MTDTDHPTKEERDRRKDVLALIERLGDDRGAPVDAVYIQARKEMDAFRVMNILRDLRRDGEIYEPQRDFLRRV